MPLESLKPIYTFILLLLLCSTYLAWRRSRKLHRQIIELENQVKERDLLLETLKLNLQKAENSQVFSPVHKSLAHDVRKPFSNLKAGLIMIKKAKDFDDVQEIVKILSPQIDKAFVNVNSMLKEISNPWSEPLDLNFEDLELVEILNSAFEQSIIDEENSEIGFVYTMNHHFKVKTHKGRIDRVVINILSKVFKLTGMTGVVRFETHDSYLQREQFIKLLIVYPGVETPGGAALKIAEQILINLKGGYSFSSDASKNESEFLILIPASTQAAVANIILPKKVADIFSNFTPKYAPGRLPKKIGINLVIVEDSEIIHAAWSQAKDPRLRISLFFTPEEFLLAAENSPELYSETTYFLFDYNFGDKSKSDGFWLAQRIKSKTRGKLFLYSDVDLSELPKDFDARLPKEIYSFQQLESFL